MKIMLRRIAVLALRVLIRSRIDEAIDAYKKALAIKPDFADALWNLSGTASLRKSKQ